MYRYIFFVVILLCTKAFAQTSSCGVNKQAVELANLIINSENQKRKVLTCNSKLAQAAFEKAKAMSQADKITHNIENKTPNEHLKSFGVELPQHYEILGNQVEAVSGGIKTAKDSFNFFMSSEDHKEHLLGENDFYFQQRHIGVGFFQDLKKAHEYYWVVYITSLMGDVEQVVKPVKFKLIIEKPKKPRFKRGDTVIWRELKK